MFASLLVVLGLEVGVNLGGWLVVEPSMFDQTDAFPHDAAENDFIRWHRAAQGDQFALQTVRNHWENFVSDEMLDALASLGIASVRVPIGYWIFDAPVGGGGSMRDYGFQTEGFATGGINALEALLPKLSGRNMSLMLDLHALPGCDARCIGFAGVHCDDASGFFNGAKPSQPITRCYGGDAYTSTRADGRSWYEIALDYVAAMAAWVGALPASQRALVRGATVMNEPGLGQSFRPQISEFYERSVPLLGANVTLAVNVIGSSFSVVDGANWMGGEVRAGRFPHATLADYHHYYNWDGTHDAGYYLDKVCHGGEGWWAYPQNLPTFLGEWSLAVNGDGDLHDLTNPSDVAFLTKFYANQASYYQSQPNVVGCYFWNFRMGSGWDPRPTKDAPHGHHVDGASYNKSLHGFPLTSWSLLELAAHGVAVPFASLGITGRCQCNGCGST